ncbi:hypothetical protein PMKS-003108 [Pichia membranifaciens]|uniref:Uncharacterized protein n=1 Tax=Pichia membranifaciens TaxID=4926 RepID=A0A1Q2YJ72_9ASCO|nr:hypothetical protein PMKS-003108 [Pichia membranifaciens]
MGGGNLSNQFLAAEKDGLKKLKDSSEWALPVSTKALKVMKSKNKKVRRVGFSKINSMGPVSISKDLNNGTLGRMKLSSVEEPNRDEKEDNEEVFTPNSNGGKSNVDSEPEKKGKSKKSKKTKKSKVIKGFVTKSDEEFDPAEVDLTSKSLLDLWKANRK